MEVWERKTDGPRKRGQFVQSGIVLLQLPASASASVVRDDQKMGEYDDN